MSILIGCEVQDVKDTKVVFPVLAAVATSSPSNRLWVRMYWVVHQLDWMDSRAGLVGSLICSHP